MTMLATNQKEDVGRMVDPPCLAGCSDLFHCCHQTRWSGKERAEALAYSEIAAILFIRIKWKRCYLKTVRCWVLFVPPTHRIKVKNNRGICIQPFRLQRIRLQVSTSRFSRLVPNNCGLVLAH